MRAVSIEAEPTPLWVDLDRTALVIIDMQRDFLEPGGFGETLGNDVSRLQTAVGPCRAVLDAARAAKMLVIHTREGHRPDLSDAPRAKIERGEPAMRIGAPGPMGRILVRGEPGPRHHSAAAPDRRRAGRRQARQGRVPPDRPAPDPAEARDRKSAGVRRHHRGVRQHHGARGQRPRLPLHRAQRLLRVVFSRVSRCRPRHDQGAGRHLRLGVGLQTGDRGHEGVSARREACAYRRAFFAQLFGKHKARNVRSRPRRRCAFLVRARIPPRTTRCGIASCFRRIRRRRRARRREPANPIGACLAFTVLMARPACVRGRCFGGLA